MGQPTSAKGWHRNHLMLNKARMHQQQQLESPLALESKMSRFGGPMNRPEGLGRQIEEEEEEATRFPRQV